jgi:predicted DsbA family dithiol-disulfide isomerase
VPLAERFAPDKIAGLYEVLRQKGRELGISFGNLVHLANSLLAMQASEFARDHGKFAAFHTALFYAYFTELRNIGDMEVIMDIGQQLALDSRDLQAALDENIYLPRLHAVSEEARQMNITAVPTFLVNGQFKIVGALPIETFRRNLLEIDRILSGQKA